MRTGEPPVTWPESETRGLMADVVEQVAPKPNERPAVWDAVIEDMRARDAHGRKHYGTPLQAMNGRNPFVDAYQESLDQTVYLKQAVQEHRERRAALDNVMAMAARLHRKSKERGTMCGSAREILAELMSAIQKLDDVTPA